MGMKKEGSTAVATAPRSTSDSAAQVAAAQSTPSATASTDSGTAAAVGRLNKTKAEPASKASAEKTYVGRDFEKEARGKTRCVQFEAALMSPAIAGMKFETMEQYLALIKQAADAGVAYTFGE